MDLWFETALLPDSWADRVSVTVVDGRMAAIRADSDPAAAAERHFAALPGLPNVHSHAFQRGMAGLAERRGPGDDSFWTWRETMYRFVGGIDPEAMAAIAALAYAEMLESGFTRVGEFHYLHHAPDGAPYADPAEMAGAIARAAETTGIGMTLLPVFYAQSGFGGGAPAAEQRRFVTDLDGYVRLVAAAQRAVRGLPDAVVGLAPHSLRAVPLDALDAIATLGRDRPVHLHIAEQRAEVDACRAWCGRTPIALLLDRVTLGRNWCLVHATHATAAERHGIVSHGASVGLCPITEANLGDGIFAADAFLAAGGAIGVGSDSNVRIDAAEELRLLEYGQRLARERRCLLATGERPSVGAALYDAAGAGGARALGAGFGLTIGAPADIVSLDAADPAYAARRGDALIDARVFGGGAIDCVWRHGRKRVAGGRHRDRDAIRARFAAALGRLLA